MPRHATLPVADFFRDPERAAPQLSPDGAWLSFLASVDGRMNVVVQPIGGGRLQGEARPVTDERERSLVHHLWANDSRHILFAKDAGGDENHHVMVVDIQQGPESVRDLTPFDGVRAVPLAAVRAQPGQVLVLMNRRDPSLMDVHRVTIATGEITMEAENPGGATPVTHWVADRDDQVRAAVASLTDGSLAVLVRDEVDQEFRVLRTYGPDDLGDNGGSVFGFTQDGGSLLVGSAAGVDRRRLVALSLDDATEVVLDEHREVDLEEILCDAATGELLCADYVTHTGRVRHGFGSAVDDVAQLTRLHLSRARIVAWDRDGRWWVLASNEDVAPDVYDLFDRVSGEVHRLFAGRPWLEEAELAPMIPVTVIARDGLVLPSYLTLPVGRRSRDLPMVLLVHGGPWARDTWRFHPEVQFLADRGHAVLQVNFRGSTGFGKAFVQAAEQQWARAMHDDLVDAVSWAVGTGIVDQRRIAIYGASYGGYAALCGAAFTPDVFAAAISYVGPSNLLTLLRSFPRYWAPLTQVWRRHVGDPDDPAQEQNLRDRSPLFSADKIVAPLLVAQGANDPRVTQVESDQIVEALRGRGVDVRYLVKQGEGHGFANQENRLEFYDEMEAFLAKHLGN